MVRRRVSVNRRIRVKDLSGGLMAKYDTARVPTNFLTDVRNMRFGSGCPETRLGNAQVATLTRPSGAARITHDTGDYVLVPRNSSSPIWTGMKPQWTVEFVVRPESMPGSPSMDQVLLFEWGNLLGDPVVSVRLGTGKVAGYPLLNLFAHVRDKDMASPLEKNCGAFEGSGGQPLDRRYYVRLRRDGKDVDCLILGGLESGLGWSQYTVHSDVFADATAAMGTADGWLYIGGHGNGSVALYAADVTLDELRIWNKFVTETSKTAWTEHPMAEDPELLGYWRLNGNATDESLYGNDGEAAGVVSWVTGEVEGLMVGQFVGEYNPGAKLHRLVAAGGSIFREVVR